MIKIYSFSYYFGQDADVEDMGCKLFDCRHLPDPQGLGHGFSGKEKSVQDYVFQDGKADGLLRLVTADIITYKYTLVAFGCIAGKNRSVSMAERLKDHLEDFGIEAEVEHLALPIWEEQR